MSTKYNYKEIEKKWRANWEKNPVNPTNTDKPKYYCLDMFPYPSANGLQTDALYSISFDLGHFQDQTATQPCHFQTAALTSGSIRYISW